MRLKAKFLNVLLCSTLFFLSIYGLQKSSIDQAYAAPRLQSGTPSLAIGSVSAQSGNTVAVPVVFQSNGANVGAMSFSIVFDDTCLAYVSNTLNVPSAFNASMVTLVDADSDTLTDGVNVIIFAFSPTPVSLPATLNPILTLNLTAKAACAGTSTPVTFTPGQTSFNDANTTLPINGTTSNGAVTISGVTPPTNTPVTPTNTPVTPTNTPVTPTNTPVTPTNTPVTPTNTPVPPTNTPTNTPVNTLPPTSTPTNTPTPVFTGPALIIGNVSALGGGQATVPIAYQANNTSISTLVFTIDYDQSCLAFNSTDANNNGIPDAITFFTPAGFTTAATVTGNANGELNIVIGYAAQPAASLPSTDPLLTIQFTATCQPAAGATQVAPVNFGTNPEASFGTPGGTSVHGNTVNGSVTISGPALPTATPTDTPVTPTNTPVTPTNTPVTPTNTPVTPTVTPVTPTVTPPPVSGLILVSASDEEGKVDGLSFKDEDILVYNTASNNWTLVFDGSDVGWGKVDLEAFDVLADGSLLLTPSKKLTIPGLGEVTPSDIVRFIPTSLGATTAGTFEWYFDGSDVGLSGSSEYLDAIAFDPSGRLLISTEGSFDAGGVKGADEDLIAFTKTSLGANTAGTWALYFDGSRVALTKGDEDVDAAWVKSNGDIYLSTKGKFAAVGSTSALSGDKNDVFICKPLATGAATDCTFAAFFDGDAVRFKYDVDDVAVVTSNQLLPFSVAAAAVEETEGEQYAVGAADEQSDQVVDEELTEVDLDRDETLTQRLFIPFAAK